MHAHSLLFDGLFFAGFEPNDLATMLTLMKSHRCGKTSQLQLSFLPGRGWGGIPPGEVHGAVARLWSQLAKLITPKLNATKIELLIEHLELESLDYMDTAVHRVRKALGT